MLFRKFFAVTSLVFNINQQPQILKELVGLVGQVLQLSDTIKLRQIFGKWRDHASTPSDCQHADISPPTCVGGEESCNGWGVQ
jgi:hypothetical protein